MVCLGNICRSPTAEGVLRKLVRERDLDAYIEVDSAGTSGWHDGEGPDPRTVQAALNRGYDLAPLVSRKVTQHDFDKHDYILAMDAQNLHDLRSLCPRAQHGKLGTLLQYGNSALGNVPDPYDCGPQVFEQVIDLCEQSCAALLAHLIASHQLPARRGQS